MPFVALRANSIVAFFGFAFGFATPALAQVHSDPRVCARLAEEGQRARATGKLRNARERFYACSSDLCPSLMRQDCATWLTEVAPAIPTIVVDARDGDGHDIADVVVKLDDEVIASKLDGQAIQVDPGPHTLTFERRGFVPATEKVIIKEGMKARPFVVTLATAIPAPAAEPEVVDDEKLKTRRIAGGITMGVGAVFAALAVYEVIRHLDFEDRIDAAAQKVYTGSDCRTTSEECADLDKKSKTATTLAVVFGATGLIALGVGAYFFFSRPASDLPPKPKTQLVPTFSVGSAGVSVLGTF